MIDSLMGATLQFSGLNKKTGKVSNSPGTDIVCISGQDILNNNQVNFFSCWSPKKC